MEEIPDRLEAAFGFIQSEDIQDRIKERRISDQTRHQNWLNGDPLRRVIEAQRKRVITALKGNTKADKTMNLIGCSREELRSHIERQFTAGMTWENFGAWEIDHKRPCASYDHSDFAQHFDCFHFSNLQPLWKRDNRSKGAKYDASTAPSR